MHEISLSSLFSSEPFSPLILCWIPSWCEELTWKDPDAGKDWRREEKRTTEEEMVVIHLMSWDDCSQPCSSVNGISQARILEWVAISFSRGSSWPRDWTRVSCIGDLASPTQWTWVWVNSGSWWWTGRPDVLQSMGSQRIGHNWTTKRNW